MAVLLLTDGRFQRNRLLRHAHDLPYLFHRHLQLFGDLLVGRLVTVLVQQLAVHLFHLVDGLHHVYRNANGTCLVGNGTGDCLPDPPCCIGGKLKALGVVKLLNRLDQAQIALLNEVKELHAASHIALGNGNHQTEVRLGKTLLCRHIAL